MQKDRKMEEHAKIYETLEYGKFDVLMYNRKRNATH